MGKVIVKNVVKRKPGHLYYIDGKGHSNLFLNKQDLIPVRSKDGPWRKKKEKEEKSKKEKEEEIIRKPL